ncbi:MAG: alpha/beta hydrolase, partial [Verrucomicrobia bacterium]|nr:alpha/beta hydrolase [Verrucomicrobiota bacterium]
MKILFQTRRRSLTGLALFFAASLFLSAAGRTDDAREPAVYKKVDGRELKLFITKPPGWKAADQRPAIVFFHGGGWVGGGPNSFVMQSEYLATRGMVCVEVDYRLLSKTKPEEPPLVCVQDAKSAMRWVRAHAKELGIDPKRIAAGGGSAGGHLAAFTGMVEGLDDPQDDKSVSPKADALVLFNPVFDNGPTGWGHARVGDRYKEFSPAHNITADDPPAVIFLGTKDKLVPVKTAEKFQADMKAAGVRCETHFYEGQQRAFFNREPWKTRTLVEADKF